MADTTKTKSDMERLWEIKQHYAAQWDKAKAGPIDSGHKMSPEDKAKIALGAIAYAETIQALHVLEEQHKAQKEWTPS